MKLIIDIDDDIAKGIRGENDCNVEPREIVRDFQATISEAIANGIHYEERPHGKWIRQSESRTIFFCSNCGREINTSPFTRTDNFPYCHCGADMRGRQ